MKFLCPSCRAPLTGPTAQVVACPACGVAVDLTRVETAPGEARLAPEVDLTAEPLGKYHLSRRIGSGGMGAVYEATGPEGRVAVKVLSTMLAAEPALRERFRREAQALRAVSHPHVVRVLADGQDRGFCWYAMELVEGPDLRARLQRGPLAPAEALTLAKELLGALEAAHAAGLVHRDVKPGNVLLSPSGAKLCDFGIAKLDGSATLTESAALLGSLRYMAPEQRHGRTDRLTDLYSLGLVLHEALAGTLPPEGTLPAGPRNLVRLVQELTRESPRDRPQSSRAALDLLAARSRRALVAGAVGVASLVVAGLLAGGLLSNSPTVAKTEEPPVLKLEDLTGSGSGLRARNLAAAPAESQAVPTMPVEEGQQPASQVAVPNAVWERPPANTRAGPKEVSRPPSKKKGVSKKDLTGEVDEVLGASSKSNLAKPSVKK